MLLRPPRSALFFYTDTARTEIYTLTQHDALPIFRARDDVRRRDGPRPRPGSRPGRRRRRAPGARAAPAGGVRRVPRRRAEVPGPRRRPAQGGAHLPPADGVPPALTGAGP